MSNILRNNLYPYIEKYINEYLHGFQKDRIKLELINGKVTLEKLSLRPDTINKIMDEQNVPFWIKVGLIKKIYVGASKCHRGNSTRIRNRRYRYNFISKL